MLVVCAPSTDWSMPINHVALLNPCTLDLAVGGRARYAVAGMPTLFDENGSSMLDTFGTRMAPASGDCRYLWSAFGVFVEHPGHFC